MYSQFFKRLKPGDFDTLISIPPELIAHIVILLSSRDIISLSSINKRFFLLMYEHFPREMIKAIMIQKLENIIISTKEKELQRNLLSQIRTTNLAITEDVNDLVKRVSSTKIQASCNGETAFKICCEQIQAKLTSLLTIDNIKALLESNKPSNPRLNS